MLCVDVMFGVLIVFKVVGEFFFEVFGNFLKMFGKVCVVFG